MMLRSVTATVRRRAPHRLVDLLRQAVDGWGSVTATHRMTPDFLVVGAQRSGTTTLFRALSEHPAVVRPTASKGIGYFDLNYDRGERWYRGHFPLRVTARLKVRRGRVQTFESSGYYLFHPLAAGRIARDLPRVKVVVMVREPVERAYSAHRHELARGFEDQPFEQAVRLEEERTAGEADRIDRDPAYRSFAHRHFSYLARGRYAEQIERFVAALGRDRVYVVDADRFFEDPAAEFDRLRAWLELPPWRPAAFEHSNARPREPMPEPLRAELRDYYAPYDEKLEALMGRPPRWREPAS